MPRGIIAPGADGRADGRSFRYNVSVGIVTVGVRFRLAPRDPGPGSGRAPGVLLRLALAAELAGADAVLVDGGRAPGTPADPFVLLGALAAVTSRVVLGCVATSVGERHPAILAKTVAALDVCSAGRALACLAPRAMPLETGLDELAEALDVVRTMLDRPAPSYAGRHFAIEGAWNEPRAARVTPTPVGVLVPAAAATGDVALVSPGEFASLAARHADCCFVEVSNGDARTLRDVSRALATTDIPVIALIGATGDATPGDVASATRRALGAPCRGVVVDWWQTPPAEAVAGVVAAVGRAVAGRSGTA